MESAKNDEEECMMMKKLMKRALILLIATILLFQMMPMASADEDKDVPEEEEKGFSGFYIVCRPVTLMADANGSQAVMGAGRIPAGTRVKPKGANKPLGGPNDIRWYNVSYGGYNGYIRGLYLCRKEECFTLKRRLSITVTTGGQTESKWLEAGTYVKYPDANMYYNNTVVNVIIMSGNLYGIPARINNSELQPAG